MIEFELKYRLAGGERRFPAEAEKTVCQTDIYYDTADGFLLRRGNFLRVREGKRVEFKLFAGDMSHTYCAETGFSVSEANAGNPAFAALAVRLGLAAEGRDLDAFLAANGMTELARIAKRRTEYRMGNLILSHDVVEDVGEFLEAECRFDDAAGIDAEYEKARMDKRLRTRGILLAEDTPVTVGYVELYLKAHRPKLYAAGLYLEPSDVVPATQTGTRPSFLGRRAAPAPQEKDEGGFYDAPSYVRLQGTAPGSLARYCSEGPDAAKPADGQAVTTKENDTFKTSAAVSGTEQETDGGREKNAARPCAASDADAKGCGMDKNWEQVREFQQAFGHPWRDSPAAMDADRAQKRYAWMLEELNEFLQADEVVEQADAMIDLMYFALGTLVEMGVRPDGLFGIVHAANMSKLWPDGKPHYNAMGKTVKPADWQDPHEKLRLAIERMKEKAEKETEKKKENGTAD